MALASLDIPFRLFHTEFEVGLLVRSYYGKVPNELIRFWVPTFDASFFKPLFDQHVELYNENDDAMTVLEKVSFLLNTTIDNCKAEFEEFGYPICPEFYPIEDNAQIERLKAKWKVKPEEFYFYRDGQTWHRSPTRHFQHPANLANTLAIKIFIYLRQEFRVKRRI